MEIGLATAFLGGMLALLSPCSALLLPSFFAATVGARVQLLVHGGVFYLGLVITLVPFGLGLGALGSLLLTERGVLIGVTSLVLVALGLAQIFGFGFDLSRVLPGVTALQRRAGTLTGLLRTLLLGAVGGVAGFCAGPILGAILTLAMAQANPWASGAMLAVYGAGMVVPLMVIAAVWERLGPRGRRLLRGRSFEVLGREFHSTSVITGALIVVVGLVFWSTNGLLGVPTLVPTELQAWLQERGSSLSGPATDIIVILVVAVAALAVWALARRRTERRRACDAHDASLPADSSEAAP